MAMLAETDIYAAYAWVVSQEAVKDVVKLLQPEPARSGTTSVSRLCVESEPRRSLLDLEGLGKEIWRGVDPKSYVSELRDEWDHR